jgi:BirA family transcriptional regulator, biotin operon repressor / biotin---[acetyl-CoA-carboxylase] ligase
LTIPIDHLASIDSTNAEAMRRIAKGLRGPGWIIADEQTAGRGRSGRSWASKPGNFYGSLILPVAARPAVAHHLSLLMSVAVFDALTEVAGGRPIPGLRLKWPNDIQVGHAKLCGLLPESTSDPRADPVAGGLLVVFGIGVNLVTPSGDLGRPVASLAEYDISLRPDEMAAPLSTWMLHWLSLWKAGDGFDAVLAAWLKRAGARGEAMQVNGGVNTGVGAVSGTFDGLDIDGALLLRLPSGQVQRFTYGDVTLAAAR